MLGCICCSARAFRCRSCSSPAQVCEWNILEQSVSWICLSAWYNAKARGESIVETEPNKKQKADSEDSNENKREQYSALPATGNPTGRP